MNDTCVAMFLFLLGFMGPIGAIQFKLGKMKASFLPLPINPAIPASWFYGGWPIGIGSLLVGIGFVTDNRTLAMIGLFGVAPFAFVFMFWKPNWLKPDWLLWLEDHYDQSMLDFMFQQAKQDKSWSQKVDTQTRLEAWAKEMERKYRSYMGNGYG
jgi:hypothetical protein